MSHLNIDTLIVAARGIKNAANDITGKTREFGEGAATKSKKATRDVQEETSSALERLRKSIENIMK